MSTAKKTNVLKKKKHKEQHPEAKLYLHAGMNNTILSLTDMKGNVILSSSCGKIGYRNCRKSTPLASQTAITTILSGAYKDIGVRRIHLIIRGPGIGRDMLTFLQKDGIEISSITDDTGIPHNGVRPKKARRT